MPIALSDDTKAKALASLKRYFDEQLEQELGDLQAGLLLEFILREIGPSIYNGAIGDAETYLRDRLTDLEGTCFVPEFAYWPRGTTRRSSR